MTTIHETIRKWMGPSLRELVEEGDYETARNLVQISWIGMVAAGFAIGVELSRLGWI